MITLSSEDFVFVQSLVREATGILIEDDKRYLVEARLEGLLRKLARERLEELLGPIRKDRSSELRRQLIEAMTNNETSFFRDISMFDMLRTHLIPKLIEARKTQRRLVIWSAAASTGQEIYSLVMLLAEHFQLLAGWDVQLYATDYVHENLERAKRGRYTQYEINRGLPAALLVRHFRQEEDEWVLHDALRAQVRFRQLNLVTDYPPAASIDLVLLRNVMIYWELETKRSVLDRLRHVLAPDGGLVLGGAESTFQIDESYERIAVGPASYYHLPRRVSLRP